MFVLELVNVVDEIYMGIYNVIFLVYFYVGGKVKFFKESYGGVVDVIFFLLKCFFLKGGIGFSYRMRVMCRVERFRFFGMFIRWCLRFVFFFMGMMNFGMLICLMIFFC